MTTQDNANTAILLINCPDQRGIVYAVTEFIQMHQGSVLELEQHVDTHEKRFFMRIEWDLTGFDIPRDQIGDRFDQRIGRFFEMQWALHFSEQMPRMAIFVSKHAHCLYDILARYQAQEWRVEIPLIISNHNDLAPVAQNLGIDYHHLPIDKSNKAEQEAAQLKLLKQYNIDVIVLARYMQILSDAMVQEYPNQIINIHHSFLPAFVGAKPYHSAYERGVKVIGATSHYVTAELDAGPIIEQDVIKVRHSDNVDDLVRKGRDIEKVVLARAIWHHLRRQVLVCNNRTIVFG